MRRSTTLIVSLVLVMATATAVAQEADELIRLSPPLSANNAFRIYFGQDVDIDVDTGRIVAGADGHLPQRAGGAYVIERDGSGWSFTLLQIDPPATPARAGAAVAIEGDLVAVAAPLDGRVETFAGAVYLFRLVDEVWQEEAILAPEELQRDDFFGLDVDIDGGRVVVGATGDEDGAAVGRVFLYERIDGEWQYDIFESPDGIASDYFGSSVHLNGSMLAVGATGVDGEAIDQGAVYLYRKIAGLWSMEQKIEPLEPFDYLYFGVRLHGDGDRIAVTAAGNFDHHPTLGRVYLLTPDSDGWSQEIAYADSTYANLGTSVVIDGSTIYVGAMGSDNYLRQPGQVLVLREAEGAWTLAEVIGGFGNGVTENGFGWSTAGADGVLVIGAPGFRPLGEGSGEIFVRGVEPTCFGLTPTIFGTPDEDVIVGTEDADVIVAGSGDDHISGLWTGDIVCTGVGWDVVEARPSFVVDRSSKDRFFIGDLFVGSDASAI